MIVSVFATTMLFLSFTLLGIGVLLNRPRLLRDISISILLLPILIVGLRFLLPFELPFAKTVSIPGLYATIVRFLSVARFEGFGIQLSIAGMAGIAWAIGCVAKCIRVVFANARFFGSLRGNASEPPPRIRELCEKSALALGCEASFTVLQSEIISSPVLAGHLDPKILIPKIELSDPEWEFVFKHEILHHRYGDLWTQLLLEAICVIYWWNPLIYYFRRQVSDALEMRVDLGVFEGISEDGQVEYLECLLKFAKERKFASRPLAAYSEYARAATLSKRFDFMIQEKSGSSLKRAGKTAAAVCSILLGLTLSVFIVLEPYWISKEDAAETFELAFESTYFVINGDGYDIYIENEYTATILDVPQSMANIPIYNTLEEAHDETKK